ncbi:MAG: hypothetical protein KC609_07300 [Myxococcales bacterium]|nr:hypothetical protein [Myxococcales bacterium]
MNETNGSFRWWGEQNLAPQTVAHWQLGSLDLFIDTRENELRIAYSNKGDPLADARMMSADVPPGELDPKLEWSRYMLGETRQKLELRPILADRPVISRPTTATYLLSRETMTLFLSTPLWLRIYTAVKVADPNARPMVTEMPMYRPSDTWFGASMTEGEFCYASRTQARTQIDGIKFRPHRATTPIVLHNHSATTLAFDRIKIPVTHLPLFANTKHQLWTPTLQLTLGEAQTTEIKIGEHPPDTHGPWERISAPRDPTGLRLVDTVKMFLYRGLFHD